MGLKTRIVAIDGRGGAGKSTLAARLSELLGGAPVVHTDDFASWDNPIDWWPELLAQVLEPLARGDAASFVPGAGRGRSASSSNRAASSCSRASARRARRSGRTSR